MFLEDEILLAVEFIEILYVISLAFHLDSVRHHFFTIQLFHHLESLFFLLFANLLEVLFLYLCEVYFLELVDSFFCRGSHSEI